MYDIFIHLFYIYPKNITLNYNPKVFFGKERGIKMISKAFVNGEMQQPSSSSPFLSLERAMIDAEHEIDEMLSSYLNTSEMYAFESELMGTIDEDKMLFLEAEGKNIFEKIGDKVIEIFNKFKNVVQGVVDKIKNIRFKSKSYEQRLEALSKKKGLKDEVVATLQKGDIDIMKVKSLKELEDLYDEIARLSMQKDIDPKTLRGKLELFKQKCQKADKSTVVKVGAAATATAAIIRVGTAPGEVRKNVLDSERAVSDYQKRVKERNEQLLKDYDKLRRMENGKYVDPNALSKAQIRQNIFYYYSNQMSKLIGAEEGKITKLNNSVLSFLARHESSKSGDYIDGLNRDTSLMKQKDNETERGERNKERKLAAAKAYGSAAGKHRYDKNHPELRDEQRKKNKEDTSDRLNAQLRFSKNHADELADEEKRKAKAQQLGRNEATPKKSLQDIEDEARAQQIGRNRAGTPKRKIKDIEAEARAQQRGRNAEPAPKKSLQDIEAEARAQQRGRNAEPAPYKSLQDIEDEAAAQQRGRNRETKKPGVQKIQIIDKNKP